MLLALRDIAARKEIKREATLRLDEAVELLKGYEGYVPTSPLSVEVRGHKLAEGFQLRLKVKGDLEGTCKRCLCEVPVQVEMAHQTTLLPARHALPEEEELAAEDLDVLYYGSLEEDFDADPLLKETLLLGLEPYLVCDESCAGLCAQCGADLNKTKCACEAPIDPRWAGLLELKKKKEKKSP